MSAVPRLPFIRIVLIGTLVGLASLLAVRFVPSVNHDMGPATVSARGDFGEGATTLFVPPLGTVEADTHISPLGITLTVTAVDPNALGRAVAGEVSRQFLEDEIEADLRGTAVRLAVQLAVGGIILGLVVAAILPHRTRATIVAGGMGGGLVLGIVLLLTASTFDVEAFQEPRFTGALERAPQVIAALDRRVESFGRLQSRYESAAGRLSDLLTLVAEPARDPQEDSVAILHVGDVHSNPIGIEITSELARRFQVEAVVDTGDLTSFGQPVEARIGDLIARVPVPYFFVPGNHDSPVNRRALGKVKNVTLLDDDVVEVEGLEILGWGDPTFTASNELETEAGNEIRIEEAADVGAAVDDELPDVLAVHDERLASESLGDVPLVIAGHTHERALEVVEDTTIMTVGSTGATGLGSFIVEADLAYEAEVVYFRDQEPVAYDYISFSGLGEEFEVERSTLVDPEPVGRL